MSQMPLWIAAITTRKELQEARRALQERELELDRADLALGGFLSEDNQCEYCGVTFEYRHPSRIDRCEQCKPCYERRNGKESGMIAFRVTAPSSEDFEPRTI